MQRIGYLSHRSTFFRCLIIFIIFMIIYFSGFQFQLGIASPSPAVLANLQSAFSMTLRQSPIFMVIFAAPNFNLTQANKVPFFSKILGDQFNHKLEASTITRIGYLTLLFTGIDLMILPVLWLLEVIINSGTSSSVDLVNLPESALTTIASLISLIAIEGTAPSRRKGDPDYVPR